MLVTSLECSEMVTSDLPRSQDLTLPVLSWLKGLIWGQASTGGGVHECVYKVCIHMSVLSWVVVVFGERGFFHLRSTCFGNTGLEKITQDSLLKDFSESLLANMLCDYLRVIRDAIVSKVICPQDFFVSLFMEYLMPPFTEYSLRRRSLDMKVHLSPVRQPVPR